MKRKTIAFLIALVIMIASVQLFESTAFAASRQEVVTKLDVIKNTTGFKPGELKGYSGYCHTFVNKVSNSIFKVPIQMALGVNII